VPYHLTGGTAFLERAEVKDILAYLRLIVNPDDDAAFVRVANVPRRDIGATTLEKLGELAQSRHCSMLRAAQSDTVLRQLAARSASALSGFVALIRSLEGETRKASAADLVDLIARRTGYEDHLLVENRDEAVRSRRRQNLTELAEWFRAMQRTESGIGDLAAQLALLTQGDRDDPGNAVRLMTLHSAKGLEFRFVNIIGVAEGRLPHEAGIDEGRVEEERRLMYVGITRARENLCLSYAARSRRYGEIVANQPSRFLAELPDADLHRDGVDAEQDAEARRELASSHIARLADLLAD
jgi:ATP-dependent DNA helicase Rep